MKIKYLFGACIALWFCVGSSAQTSNANYVGELEAMGYPVIKPMSFSITKKTWAATGLYKSDGDRNPLIFFANLLATKDGVNMGFKASRPCVPSNEKARLQERIIMVNGQKIRTYYQCSGAPDGSDTQDIFVIASKEGNDFVKNEFAKMKYVFVHLNDLPVPFDTDGFARVLTELNGKAL